MGNYKNRKPKTFKGHCWMCALRSTNGTRNGRLLTMQELRARDAHVAQLYEVETMGKRKDEGVPFEESRGVRATAAALLVKLGPEYSEKEIWVPKSVIHEDSEVNDVDEEGTLVLATWFVDKEGLL